MNRTASLSTLCILICLAFLGARVSAVLAFPPLPANFWGTVQVNGENVPEGSQVSAWINGVQVTQTETILHEGHSMYSIVVPGDGSATSVVEGGTASDEIEFRVDDVPADQKGAWRSGTSIELNLTATTAGTPATPLPVSTLTQAPITQPTSPTGSGQTPALSATLEGTAPLGEIDQHSTPTQPGAERLTAEAEPELSLTDPQDSPVFDEKDARAHAVRAESPRNSFLILTIVSLVIVIAIAAYLVFVKLRRV